MGSTRADIIMLLRQLPILQRTIIVLRAQAYSYREIAVLTKRNVRTVHDHARYAELTLKEIWGKDNGYSDSLAG